MLNQLAVDPFNLPPATPVGNVYPNLIDSTQHARNNFLPKRTFRRTISAQENEACLKRTLQKYWGYASFRGPQLAICLSAMTKCDILVVAPTGLGKSICFQVPAVTKEWGITIVVSPLLALMKDQVAGLKDRNIKAAMLCEKTDDATKKYIFHQLSLGHPELRLLYLTPETLGSQRCMSYLRKAYNQGQIIRLVIDEAHVIEEWGLTFRSAYRDLGKFRQEFRDIPVTAVTASATESVRDDIIESLGIQRHNLAQWVLPFNRKNLFYEVRYCDEESSPSKPDKIAEIIKAERVRGGARNKNHGIKTQCVTGLIYCRSRYACENVATELRDRGIKARPFHAQLKSDQRDTLLEQWKIGNIECIVATIAFGMGVDQAHVRYVIHFDMPKSFEGYYQETGRAGRDGHISRCILFYSREDACILRKLIEREAQNTRAKKEKEAEKQGRSLSQEEEDLLTAKNRCLNSFKLLQQYAEAANSCRHAAICRYFGEKIDTTSSQVKKAYCDNMCDVCENPGAVMRRYLLVSDEVPIASQIVPLAKRHHSAPSIPSSRDEMTVIQMHKSDGPHVSSDLSDTAFPLPADDADDGVDIATSTEAVKNGADQAVPSSPPSANTRSSKSSSLRSGHQVTSLSSGPLRPLSTTKKLAPIPGPTLSPPPPKRRRIAANTPAHALQIARDALKEVSTINNEQTRLFGYNASAGPSKPLPPPGSSPNTTGRTRTVSAFDESPSTRKSAAVCDQVGSEADEALRKRREQKQKERFMAIRPISPAASRAGGPFAYYGNGREPATQLRISGSPASGIHRPFRSPLVPEHRPRVIADRIRDENDLVASNAQRDKRSDKVYKTLEKVFKDDELGDAVWEFWSRSERGKSKQKALKLIAAAVVETIGSDASTAGSNRSRSNADLNLMALAKDEDLDLTISAFRILLTPEGVDLVVSGELAQWKGDEHGKKLLMLERLVKG